MSTIAQIKSEVSLKLKSPLTALTMIRQLDETTKQPQPWLSHWDNDARIRVVMHEEVFEAIKANTALDTLAYKYEFVVPKELDKDGKAKPSYHRIVVITPKNVEGCF